MQIIDVFSGIGGFSLAGRWIGWHTIQFCEIDKFCQRVLGYHFPNVPIHDDINTLTAEQILSNKLYNASDSTIIVGGFPCQPFSAAGKRQGTSDNRYLWPQTIKLIQQIRPDWCVLENVRGLTNWNGGLVFDQVQADLEAEGYEVLPFLLPACAVNAPHRRDRIWFVAYSVNNRYKAGRGKEREKDGIQELNRQTMDSGEFDRAGISSIITDSGLFRQAVNEQQAAGIEQQGERIIVESNWDTDEGFNDPDEQFTITHNNIRNRQEVRLQAGWKVDVDSVERNRDATDSDQFPCPNSRINKSVTKQKRQEQETRAINGGNCRITSNSKYQGLERGVIESESGRIKRTEIRGNNPRLCEKNNWANFPTVSPICDRNDGLSDRLVGITFPKWRNESIKALGNSIVPQVAYQIFKAINEFDKLR